MSARAAADWARCAAWLQPALARDTDGWDMAELEARLRAGKAQLWLGQRCAAVTELAEGPSINCWLAGGHMREIVSLTPGIEAWARARGCRFATLAGRRGWARVLAPFGYAPCEGEIRKVLWWAGKLAEANPRAKRRRLT